MGALAAAGAAGGLIDCRRRRGRGGRLVGAGGRVRLGLQLLLAGAPLEDVGVVVLQRLGEDVAAGAVGDEIELLGVGRIEHGLDRGAARVADRRRRQAVDL